MNVLSLFDGISCSRVALDKLNIDCNYYASEVDKYPIGISKHRYKDIIQLGDVSNISFTDNCLNTDNGKFCLTGTKKIDLLIGGSPCQNLSIAGNRKGLDGEKSALFFEYLRLLKETMPKYFILENVASMGNANKEMITNYLKEIYPETVCYMINGSDFTAQSRKRLFFTNIQDVAKPIDKQIYLKDIILDGITEKDKSLCVTATYNRACPADYFKKSNRQLIFTGGVSNKDIVGDEKSLLRNYSQGDRVYSFNGKSVTLSALGGGRGAKTGLYEFLSTVNQFREIRTEKGRENRKLNRIKSLGDTTLRNAENKEFVPRGDGKSNCLTTQPTYEINTQINYEVRKLHPIECERLMGLEDDYTKYAIINGLTVEVPKTHRYKACGNAFIPAIIEHILQDRK